MSDLVIELEMIAYSLAIDPPSKPQTPKLPSHQIPPPQSSILLPRPCLGTLYNPQSPDQTKPKIAFKPRPTPSSASLTQGTKQYQLRKYAEQTLGSGNLRNAVVLPEGEEVCEWVAVHGKSRLFDLGHCVLGL
jgi:hypothetical protein